MSELMALLMTRMWVVRSEGNPAMHVVIAQVCWVGESAYDSNVLAFTRPMLEKGLVNDICERCRQGY